jgi:hypothetical protein
VVAACLHQADALDLQHGARSPEAAGPSGTPSALRKLTPSERRPRRPAERSTPCSRRRRSRSRLLMPPSLEIVESGTCPRPVSLLMGLTPEALKGFKQLTTQCDVGYGISRREFSNPARPPFARPRLCADPEVKCIGGMTRTRPRRERASRSVGDITRRGWPGQPGVEARAADLQRPAQHGDVIRRPLRIDEGEPHHLVDSVTKKPPHFSRGPAPPAIGVLPPQLDQLGPLRSGQRQQARRVRNSPLGLIGADPVPQRGVVDLSDHEPPPQSSSWRPAPAQQPAPGTQPGTCSVGSSGTTLPRASRPR